MIDLNKVRYTFPDLVAIMARLRAPDGCPWDRAQTHPSLRRYLLEEAYETADAIDRGDPASLCEELGDVLLHVVFHAAIAGEQGTFTLDDVCDGICRKMLARHPALFGGGGPSDWEAIKQARYGSYAEAMDHVARALPALTRAEKLMSKAAQAGFDWPDVPAALDKAAEELSELRAAAAGQGDAEEELGDLLLAAARAADKLGADPERALERACDKFTARFSYMEGLAAGKLPDLSLTEQLALWRRAKEEV